MSLYDVYSTKFDDMVASIHDCQTNCENKQGCRAFEYNPTTKTCGVNGESGNEALTAAPSDEDPGTYGHPWYNSGVLQTVGQPGFTTCYPEKRKLLIY